ncbi:unnamed protein product [Didymodactylos carnosus]|uniref:Chorismate-utilising enzyme C-terminal domain-containing protein n=1 Tax=Didymodactylos carnosus TaxID=1234261 RepID=A0A815NLX0_9BILA|nr:unnamed protein product [Didymodactylos carnosus]CAF4317487.1 unnamed protein product [Didymodactylos carnosus]
MLALGSAQQFAVHQATLHSQEFHAKAKQMVEGDWQRLLVNGIVENCVGRNFAGHGPVLAGGLCFDHQNTHRSGKWSRFDDVSFVLPSIQFTHEDNQTYITFNTVITNCTNLEQEMQLIDSEIITLLEICHKLLKGAKQYADDISKPPCDLKSVLLSDPWKETVRDTITNIRVGDLEKVILVRETEFATDLPKITNHVTQSFTRLCTLYPSSYVFGVLRHGSCFSGVTSPPVVRLVENQLEVAALTSTDMGKNNENEPFSSSQQQREHDLVLDFVKHKLQPIIEGNSVMVSVKSTTLKLAANGRHVYALVRGTTRRETTLLDLVQALHPMPAVSGLPQSDALKLLREKESLDRG